MTKCPYEAVGENLFGRGLLRTQERTAWDQVDNFAIRSSNDLEAG